MTHPSMSHWVLLNTGCTNRCHVGTDDVQVTVAATDVKLTTIKLGL